jgi:chromate reductase
MTMKIGVVVGSLRRESFSRKIAENVVKLLPDSLSAEWFSIDLPISGAALTVRTFGAVRKPR